MKLVEEIIGFEFKDNRYLLWEALQCVGSTNRGFMVNRKLPEDMNESLAGIGDAMADLWINMIVYQERKPRCVADNRRQAWLCNKNLARRGRELGLAKFVARDPNLVGPVSERQMATVMEAIVGATLYVGGTNAARNVLLKMDLGKGLSENGGTDH